MDCLLKNCVIIIPAKLCNQRKIFSHDVELNNKGILYFTFTETKIIDTEIQPHQGSHLTWSCDSSLQRPLSDHNMHIGCLIKDNVSNCFNRK